MRIVHLIQSLGIGGAETMLIKLANQDVKNQILILTLIDECPLKVKLKNNNVEVISVSDRDSFKLLNATVKVYREVSRFKPDVLQAWMYHSELIGLFIKILKPKIKLFWNVRCSTGNWRNLRLRNRFILQMLVFGSHFTSGIFVNSKSELRYLNNIGYKSSKLIYIPNGFETSKIGQAVAKVPLRENLRLPEDSRIVGIVARNHPDKDIGNLISAWARVRKVLKDVHLVIAGPGYDEAFVRQMKSIQIDNSIYFVGPVDDAYALMENFTIGVLSSRSESFPNVIAEYMLSGLPVVSTDVSDIGNIIGENGIIVPPGDPVKLADAILALLDLPDERKREIGSNARQLIVDRFGIDKVYSLYDTCYNNSFIP